MKWHRLLSDATESIGETFILLEPDRRHLERERTKFFDSGCQINPDLRPRHLDDMLFERAIGRLDVLRDEIAAQEPNKYIREAYVCHIRDYITNLKMIRYAISAEHENFIDGNIELYGMPDARIFEAVCAWIRNDVMATSAGRPDLEDFSVKLLPLLPAAGGDPSILLPNNKVFRQVRDMHFTPGGYFHQLFAPDGIPEEPYVEQRYGDGITKQAIANVGSDYAVGPAADGLWAVLSRSRKVIRPLGYRVDRSYFTGVIAHEVGSHLLEESNGSRQPLRLLGLGLNGFEKGNEGRAYLREQIVYPDESVFVRQASWEYILALHLSVSLASGLSGTRYTFVELYRLLYALHRFWRERRYPLDTINEAQAREEAWLLAVRIMKGTDGSGGCYMKDTVYLEGSIACWKLAEKNPESILLGDIGKFNITDSRHVAILRGLAILDDA